MNPTTTSEFALSDVTSSPEPECRNMTLRNERVSILSTPSFQPPPYGTFPGSGFVNFEVRGDSPGSASPSPTRSDPGYIALGGTRRTTFTDYLRQAQSRLSDVLRSPRGQPPRGALQRTS
eukprot:CAMPEP_0206330088 /NCGR_PEP_ID=MMETSP0106_2-20121207/23540_1 /ASSEMBLY_ACC=CAM_ASM_000206 /TAXON_ID=81532 /ORGANISM="Acanthoeca-like sp., Strain 10tr" /LENGTH=119 /DNA_ID=CAMNT_0053762839 /DNA_START=210 /DNA_END=569 /DNA_ORIENTATION=+